LKLADMIEMYVKSWNKHVDLMTNAAKKSALMLINFNTFIIMINDIAWENHVQYISNKSQNCIIGFRLIVIKGINCAVKSPRQYNKIVNYLKENYPKICM
jgi:hypothetical protein